MQSSPCDPALECVASFVNPPIMSYNHYIPLSSPSILGMDARHPIPVVGCVPFFQLPIFNDLKALRRILEMLRCYVKIAHLYHRNGLPTNFDTEPSSYCRNLLMSRLHKTRARMAAGCGALNPNCRSHHTDVCWIAPRPPLDVDETHNFWSACVRPSLRRSRHRSAATACSPPPPNDGRNRIMWRA